MNADLNARPVGQLVQGLKLLVYEALSYVERRLERAPRGAAGARPV